MRQEFFVIVFLLSASAALAQAREPENNSFGVEIQSIAVDMMRMEACRASWNNYLQEQGLDSESTRILEPDGKPFTLNTVPGKKYIYAPNALPDTEICGWYFIPFGSSKDTQLEAQAQTEALTLSRPTLTLAGRDILNVSPATITAPQSQLSYNSDFMQGVNDYYKAIWKARTVFKISSYLSSEELPVTSSPKLTVIDSERNSNWDHAFGSNSDIVWNLRKRVVEDIKAFDPY